MFASPVRRPRRTSTARSRLTTTFAVVLGMLVCTLPLAACGGGSQAGEQPVLHIGAIPDQDPELLQRLNRKLSDRLSDDVGVKVEYVPVTDYTAAVTGYRVGDLDMVWFGGLTGVQARLQVPGSRLLAQRDIDAHFHSVFIANADSGIRPFDDEAGLRQLTRHTFTFGSETSTSGSLMPQYFLRQAGVDNTRFRGEPGFSESHDATIDLVQAGSFDAGALNEQVWKDRVAAGTVNLDRVREVWRTPAYQDYHWLARPDIDERFGDGTTAALRRSLLGLDYDKPRDRSILKLFGARRFVPTKASNYDRVEQVGRQIGLVRSP